MSLEHSPTKATDAAAQGGPAALPEIDLAYWNSFIDESAAGDFVGLATRTMQDMRLRGGGPPYSKINKAVRYTRRRLKTWADQNVRTSTSDPGMAAA